MNKTLTLIFQLVSEEFEVSVDELLSKDRHLSVVLARHCALYIARSVTRLSFPQLTKETNRGDHSTVMSACKHHAKRLETDADLANRTKRIMARLEIALRAEGRPVTNPSDSEESWVAKIVQKPFAEAG